MLTWIGLSLDLEVRAGYVRYRRVPSDDCAHSKRISEDLVADYTATGELLGIELLAFDDAAMGQARSFAAEYALAFPDLSLLL